MDITTILAGPAFAVDANDAFEINITFAHNSFESQDAHDLILSIIYPANYVLPPDDFTYQYGNGNSGTEGELRLLV